MTAPAATPISLLALLPELVLTGAGCVALLAGQAGERVRRAIPWIALGGIAVAIFVTKLVALPPEAHGNGLEYGPLALFVRDSALILGVLITLIAWSQPTAAERGEFFAMLLFSLTGLLLVGAANDLLILFLALELVSIPTYILVTLSRTRRPALESGIKYFYLGALSAAITAYGFSFLYGISGTAALGPTVEGVRLALQQPGTLRFGLATAGVVLALGGLLFKIAAVPLHFYIADVYQGAASSVAGLLTFVPKLAGFVAIFQVILLSGFWNMPDPGVFWTLWVVAALSMAVGNTLALMQTNIKRMLAYSGIAHSGYMLVGVLAGPDRGGQGLFADGTAAVLYYAVIYGLTNLGAFAILGLLNVRGEPCETVRDVAGLLRRRKDLALLLALSMLTLMGLPPTPGFWGKLNLFGSALAASQAIGDPYRVALVGLVVFALVNTAVGAAYYLRVVAAILLYENDRPAEAAPREAQYTGAVLCGLLILFFAFYPTRLLMAGRAATTDVRRAAALPASVIPPVAARPPDASDAGADSVPVRSQR